MNVFPVLPGLAWSVTKTPEFKGRKQTGISGRELRLLDQALPIWHFKLVYEFLRDGGGFDELRTLMGFFAQQQGSFQAFLFAAPGDNQVAGQALPAASMVLQSAAPNAGGTAYVVGDQVQPAVGSGTAALLQVTGISGGAITGLAVLSGGAYSLVAVNNVALSGGSGSGATANLSWLTTTQLVRTMGVLLPSGGLVEPIVAPDTVSQLYYNGMRQSGWSVDGDTGIVTLAAPFTGPQPAISADFTYWFRCRFEDDQQDFENFMYQLWSLKEMKFQSVLP